MKSVDIILSGPINSIIGPVGTLKRLLSNQDFFNSKGYDLTVFTDDSLSFGPFKEPPTERNAISTNRKGLRRLISSAVVKLARKSLLLSCLLINRDRKKVKKLIDYYISLRRTPDIIEFHSCYECSFYLENRLENNAKTVMFLHSDGIPFKMEMEYYPHLKGSKYLQKLLDEFLLTINGTNKIVFIANTGRNNFLNLYPNKDINETSVILNGINDFTANQKKEIEIVKNNCKYNYLYRLCCTGSINARKGQRLIIEALKNIPKDILKEIHIDFIGDGSDRIPLEMMVKDNELEKHVSFLGLIPNNEVYKYLANNNIFILMSKNEGLPISIIEAMRESMAIISTEVSGIPELVKTGYNGILLNPNTEELIDLLKRLNNYDWIQMGLNSRRRFEKEFTFDRMSLEFCKMYDEVVG